MMTAQQLSNFPVFEKMGIEKVVGDEDGTIFYVIF
jgi:hypothetical protein